MRHDLALRTGWEIFRLSTVAGGASRLLGGATPEQAERYETTVLAQVHDVLLERGRIPDPRVGRNAAECAWVGDEDWAYRCRFTTPPLSDGAARLTFHGVDTVAEAFLN